MNKTVKSHLVGTTFAAALYGALTTQPNTVLHLRNEPYVDSNPKKSDPACIRVYRGDNYEVLIGALPKGSDAQLGVKARCDKGEAVTALVTNIKYTTAPDDITNVVKKIQDGERVDMNQASTMIQHLKGDTSYNEEIREAGLHTFPVVIEVEVEIDSKYITSEDEHLNYEQSPTGVMCRSITDFLGDPKTEGLYLTDEEIKKNKNFDELLGAQKNIMLAITANEGTAYHQIAGLLCYLWHKMTMEEKQSILTSIGAWDTQGEWHKLLKELPNTELIYCEDESREKNTVFNDALKLKGTADLYYVKESGSGKIILYDFKRGSMTDSKGKEKQIKKYLMQSAFYATELAKMHKCEDYEANIVFMNISKDAREPFEIERMDKKRIDTLYGYIERLVLGEKVL